MVQIRVALLGVHFLFHNSFTVIKVLGVGFNLSYLIRCSMACILVSDARTRFMVR